MLQLRVFMSSALLMASRRFVSRVAKTGTLATSAVVAVERLKAIIIGDR